MAAETLFGNASAAAAIPARATQRRREREKGVVLLLGTLSIPVLVSMMGMGIDASIMYSVKSRIQLAADGASLAAARALSIGLTTEAQAASAQANAENWFNRNFPPGTFGVSNITLDEPQVYDDPDEPMIRHVVVTAAANAPSYFMRYWGYDSTRILSTSRATRRDSVIMMVLDRSGSMNTGGATDACTLMKRAAKQFTGMFSAQRDRIGLISFSDTVHLASPPSLNFQTVLGYSNTSGSAAGAIDTISCANTTGTPAAEIIGYNELFKIGLPGALNVLLVFTDGEPNTLVLDATGYSNQPNGLLADNATCRDSAARPVNAGASPRGDFSVNPPNWTAAIDLGSTNFFQYNSESPNITGSSLPRGPFGSLSNGSVWFKFWATSSAGNYNSGGLSPSGCSGTVGATNSKGIEWLPQTDVFGNPLNITAYRPLSSATLDGQSRYRSTSDNFIRASYNATAGAASRARTTRNLWDGRNFPGVYVYAIGLGSVNHELLQRVANDPSPEANGVYGAFTDYDATQPQGAYVWAQDSTRLSQAFARIASFILRLSQ